MKLIYAAVIAVLLSGICLAQTTQTTYVRPEAAERFKGYIKDVVGPVSLAKSAASAAISTASNSPEEWEPNGRGFGRRFASNVGRNLVSSTTRYGLDEAFRLDSRYYRSDKSGFGKRLGHAVISTVTARRPSGRRTVGIPRIVGTYTGHIVAAETWYPARYSWRDGLRSGTISLGMNSLFNIVREFWE